MGDDTRDADAFANLQNLDQGRREQCATKPRPWKS
jgi:hypothetical protein